SSWGFGHGDTQHMSASGGHMHGWKMPGTWPILWPFMSACRCSPRVCWRALRRPSPLAMTKGHHMPSFTHHGATIYYEEYGQGFPILTFAPAGLQSTIAVWHRPSAPVNPITEFAPNFRVIAMDQRNAGGQSHAPITAQDGWPTYAADHIALLDHLRIDRCHLYGQCIGGSFFMSLLRAPPPPPPSPPLSPPLRPVGAPGRSGAWAPWEPPGPPGSTRGPRPSATTRR